MARKAQGRLKPVFEEKAEKNLHLSQGQGVKGCQISDKVIDTKKELAKLAGGLWTFRHECRKGDWKSP